MACHQNYTHKRSLVKICEKQKRLLHGSAQGCRDKSIYRQGAKKDSRRKDILFGSRAHGTNLVSSDYDFIIVSKDFEGIPFTDRIRKMYDFWDHDIPIEPLCYTPAEFKKKSREISIVREAVKTGVVVS